MEATEGMAGIMEVTEVTEVMEGMAVMAGIMEVMAVMESEAMATEDGDGARFGRLHGYGVMRRSANGSNCVSVVVLKTNR